MAYGNRSCEGGRARGSAGLKPGATRPSNGGRGAALEGGTNGLRQSRLETLAYKGRCRAEARQYADRKMAT
jgi:hypothetical protein